MSLWYDLKKKSYATNGKESWIKSYCDRAVESMSQKLLSHFGGAEGRHKAEDIDFDGKATVKEKIEQGFNNCMQEDENLSSRIETEKAERTASFNEVKEELQNEILVRGGMINDIREDIAPVLLMNELKDATLDEEDNSVLCIDGTGNYSAEGLELSFKAPCSKNEISRIDLTISQAFEVEEPEELPEGGDDIIEVPDIEAPDNEKPEPVDPSKKVESFTFKNGKDFKEWDYVTVLFSGTTVEVKEVYETGFFDYRISDNSRNISFLKRDFEILNEEVTENWRDIINLNDKTNALEEFRDSVEGSSIKLLKTISLEEAVASIETTFEKPLKEIYVRFIGKLDTDVNVTDCGLLALCDSGSHYFAYTGNKQFSTTTNKAFILHSREITPNYWETEFTQSTLNVDDTGRMQGLDAQTGTLYKSYSTRLQPRLERYLTNFRFAIKDAQYSFAAGSKLEIYGVEVDE